MRYLDPRFPGTPISFRMLSNGRPSGFWILARKNNVEKVLGIM